MKQMCRGQQPSELMVKNYEEISKGVESPNKRNKDVGRMWGI